LRQPNVASALIGASRPEQVEENVKAVDVYLTEDVLEKIEQILA
jgi:aryl-alcohol dehydrogenase-like predicted oxidoreductase